MRLFGVVLLCLLSLACERFDVQKASEDERVLYTIGQLHMDRVRYLRLTERDVEVLIAGFRARYKQPEDAPLLTTRADLDRFVFSRTQGVK